MCLNTPNPMAGELSAVTIFEHPLGLVALIGNTNMLRDEIIGRLVHGNIMLSMDSVGVPVTALEAEPQGDGSLVVKYIVRLSKSELAKLPSIYDPPPARPKKKRRKVKR